MVFLACVADTGAYGDERCLEATVIAPLGTSTTLALLKDVQAAQPDALDYIAGANPTPLLEEVVKELQDLSLEINGRPVSFDQAVNDIVKNI